MVRFLRPSALARRPRATVVVPCYNYGHYLPQLVAGVLDQPGVEVDIIIVDDASPDGSGDIAADIAAAHERVSLIRHQTNKGHIRTYNDGLSAATGDYVSLLSADDLLPPGALNRAVSLLEANPDVGFVYGYARSFSGEPPVVDPRVRNWSIWQGLDWIGIGATKGRSFIASPEVVMRRKALAQAGGYDIRLPHSGDLDMWLRTALDWNVGRVNGPIQALYRVHDTNMHLTTFSGMIIDLNERRKTFEILYDEHAKDRPDVRRLRPATMRALARESLRLALVAHRDGAEQEDVRHYLDFARQTDPSITSDLWWRLCEVGPRTGRQFPAAGPRRFASKVRSHLLWRHERRYGT